MSRCIWQWSRGRRHGRQVCSCKSWVEPHTAVWRGAEWLGCHPSPVSGVKSLVLTECRRVGRAVGQRVTAAVRSMGSHVAVYLAVVEGPPSRSQSRYYVTCKAGPSRALRCDVAPSGSGAIRVLCRDMKSLVRTGSRGTGRAVDRRVTAAVSSMGSHVTVYLAVVEEPPSQSPSLCV
jgi:hypothetical protein